MKICPKCSSILADNEPYCENCGYDPAFDGGSWKSDDLSLKVSRPHGEYLQKFNSTLEINLINN